MPKISPYILPLIGGMLYALGFPNYWFESLFWAPIIGFALLFYQLEHNPKSKFLKILCFAIGFNFLGFYWIPETIHTFGELPRSISYFLGSFFSLIILPQLWVYLILLIVARKNIWLKNKIEGIPVSIKLVLSAVLLTLLEQYTPQQFPAHIGHGWMFWSKYIPSMLNASSVFGSSFYSFINFYIAFCVVDYYQTKKIQKIWVINILIFFLLMFFQFNQIMKAEKKLNLKIVQANIGNFMKVHAERGGVDSISEVFDRYEKLSMTNFEDDQTDIPKLIIWPETAYPFAMVAPEVKIDPSQVNELFKKITLAQSSYLLTGGYDRKEGTGFGDYFETEYNSAILFSPQGNLQDVYHKQILIPFGETLPFPEFVKQWIAPKLPAVSFFARGETFQSFTLNNQLKFITPICYEILSSTYIRDYLLAAKNADFIVNLTNDSWYGDTSEPHQHLFLAKWRALEFKIPIVRSTNTGITSIIKIDGTESERLNYTEQNFLNYKLNLEERFETLFFKFGVTNLYVFWILLIGLQLLLARRKSLF